MDMNWQMVAAVSVVGFAIWRLMRRALAALRAPGSHSCGGCSKCPDPDIKLYELDQTPQANEPVHSVRAAKH